LKRGPRMGGSKRGENREWGGGTKGREKRRWRGRVWMFAHDRGLIYRGTVGGTGVGGGVDKTRQMKSGLGGGRGRG